MNHTSRFELPFDALWPLRGSFLATGYARKMDRILVSLGRGAKPADDGATERIKEWRGQSWRLAHESFHGRRGNLEQNARQIGHNVR